MLPKTRKTRKYCRPGKSLIAAGFLNPQRWHNLSKGEIARALREHQGLSVKEVKKVHHLKHQVCISYITTKGITCSSFFSYRIFESWQKAVESLIYNCHSLKELYTLTRHIQYDIDYFPYLVEISDVIAQALENRTCQLKLTLQMAA
ncbi:MAG TPA: hypothetical protein V6D09_08840 [Leptolyngbyaceae cyanobacterium]